MLCHGLSEATGNLDTQPFNIIMVKGGKAVGQGRWVIRDENHVVLGTKVYDMSSFRNAVQKKQSCMLIIYVFSF
jgi:hypothetical protein